MYILQSHKKGILLSLLQGVLFRKYLHFQLHLLHHLTLIKRHPTKRHVLHCIVCKGDSTALQNKCVPFRTKIKFFSLNLSPIYIFNGLFNIYDSTDDLYNWVDVIQFTFKIMMVYITKSKSKQSFANLFLLKAPQISV